MDDRPNSCGCHNLFANNISFCLGSVRQERTNKNCKWYSGLNKAIKMSCYHRIYKRIVCGLIKRFNLGIKSS